MYSQSFKKVVFTLFFVFAATFLSLNFAVASSLTGNVDSASIVTSDSSGNAVDDFALNNDDDKDKGDDDDKGDDKDDK